jgi:glycosyltransferase involved in cell wall biosynthesis
MTEISAIVLTKNEEENIIDCLEGILFCSEIIVIDDNSTDRTRELVKNFAKIHSKVKLFTRELGIDFSAQRSFGIEKATNDWIFFVDADERITADLGTEIKENVLPNSDFSGYLIPRTDFMWGKELKHGETGNIKLLRLFNKKDGSLKGTVHESWETKKLVGRLSNPILHYPHPTISEFLREINFYTDLRAQELYKRKVKANYFTIIAYPKAKFIVNYFLKLGILDGVPGLVHAVLMSFHSFLVRGKLWLLWQKN